MTTPPSTTGRTHGRSGGVTCRSGGTWRRRVAAPGARARVRDGTDRRAARACGGAGRRDRSLHAHARARAAAGAAGRLQRNVRLVRGDIRVLPFPAALAVRARHGAVRHAAVAAARTGPHGDARGGRPRAPARSTLRDRSGGRPAELERVPPRAPPERVASGTALPRHARRVRAAGPHARPDHLRAGVHRTSRPRSSSRSGSI